MVPRSSFVLGLALVVVATAPSPAGAKVIRAPLSAESYAVGPLFAPSEQTVTVTAVDGREDRSLVGGGIVGAGTEKGKGILVLYASERDGEVQELLDVGARQAVGVLGLRSGTGGLALEVRLVSLWTDMYRLTGFSPMNCLGYLELATVLKGAGGEELANRRFKLTFFENANPVFSMKEVTREGVSRILLGAVWQATAQTLIDHLGLEGDADRLAALAARIATLDDEAPARQAVFWLGLAGRGDAGTLARLEALLDHQGQRVHQAAAEALGLAKANEARPDLEAILAGARRGGWDATDLENVWYLLHSLALLGVEDLRAKIPTTKLEPRSKLEDLLQFHATGKAPELSAAEKAKLAKNLPKVARKRGG